MSKLDSGILRWRSLATGATGEGRITTTHDVAQGQNKQWDGVIRHWIKGCSCDDCEAARGANDDEARE